MMWWWSTQVGTPPLRFGDLAIVPRLSRCWRSSRSGFCRWWSVSIVTIRPYSDGVSYPSDECLSDVYGIHRYQYCCCFQWPPTEFGRLIIGTSVELSFVASEFNWIGSWFDEMHMTRCLLITYSSSSSQQHPTQTEQRYVMTSLVII